MIDPRAVGAARDGSRLTINRPMCVPPARSRSPPIWPRAGRVKGTAAKRAPSSDPSCSVSHTLRDPTNRRANGSSIALAVLRTQGEGEEPVVTGQPERDPKEPPTAETKREEHAATATRRPVHRPLKMRVAKIYTPFQRAEILWTGISRPWWKKRLLAIGMCIVLPVAVALLASLGPRLQGAMDWFGRWLPPLRATGAPTSASRLLRFCVSAGNVLAYVCALYRVGVPPRARRGVPRPSRRMSIGCPRRGRSSTPRPERRPSSRRSSTRRRASRLHGRAPGPSCYP